jgi:carbonic anhydrase/acetyltransferase-like protein (isoleucine patch superfamily)
VIAPPTTEQRASPAVKEATTAPTGATFVDPTAVLHGGRAITIGSQDYVGPFANLMAVRGATLSIGTGSNVQDNVAICGVGPRQDISISDHVILAHNATIGMTRSGPTRPARS